MALVASLPLPIDALLPEAMRLVGERRSLVLSAEPGAGKTTRVPRALFESGLVVGEVLVLEPRRLAARLAAARVAEEMGGQLGGLVGFQTRFERAFGRETRIRFVTEGILTRRIIASPTLEGIGAVVLDELHERHLAGDLSLALLRRLKCGAQAGERPLCEKRIRPGRRPAATLSTAPSRWSTRVRVRRARSSTTSPATIASSSAAAPAT